MLLAIPFGEKKKVKPKAYQLHPVTQPESVEECITKHSPQNVQHESYQLSYILKIHHSVRSTLLLNTGIYTNDGSMLTHSNLALN